MTDAPLIIGPKEREDIARLRALAEAQPINIFDVQKKMESDAGSEQHRARMDEQTIELAAGPWSFFVTYSIETGQPPGPCRHLSMSVMRGNRVPHPAALWLVAESLGFVGGLHRCLCWAEDLKDGGTAVNALQPIRLGGHPP